MTLDIQTLQYEAQNQLITLKPGRDAPSIGKKGNETAAILEKLVILHLVSYSLHASPDAN